MEFPCRFMRRVAVHCCDVAVQPRLYLLSLPPNSWDCHTQVHNVRDFNIESGPMSSEICTTCWSIINCKIQSEPAGYIPSRAAAPPPPVTRQSTTPRKPPVSAASQPCHCSS